MSRSSRSLELALVGAITLAAAALRLVYIQRVSPDPFYDAAVRSMGLSWHNFFFGAFEPGGSVSIDKPPVDLWLQVISVKIFGFSSTTLKFPEILAGVAAVPLLYETVRRMSSGAAGLAAAAVLAALPVSVITARSDTMDAVMMLCTLIALFFLVRMVETDRRVWLAAAAVSMGVAFNVKLLESIIALPGLLAFAYVGLAGARTRRVASLAAAGALYLVVALAWLTATLAVPAHSRPYAIGSTNGSAWNAAFVFNGTDRLGNKSPEPQFTVYEPGHHYPEATQSERDHIPIVPPSPTRLLARIGPLSGQRLGLVLLVAILLGVPALAWGVMRAREEDAAPARRGDPVTVRAGGTPSGPEPAPNPPSARMRRATAAGFGLWTLTGTILFSEMARLHPRYVEAFTPAVAGMLGIGLAWACTPRGRARPAVLGVTLVVVVYYAERLLYGVPPAWWVTLLGALGAGLCAWLARLEWIAPRARVALAPAGAMALSLVAVLAVPLKADFTSIKDGVTDAGYVGALPSNVQSHLSGFTRARQGNARYQLAAESATGIGSLIVQDARPVLVLTSYGSRVFTPVARLRQLIAQGQVRYAYLNSRCGRHASAQNAACAAPVRWVRAHGTDVSAQAGLKAGTLWLLPGAQA